MSRFLEILILVVVSILLTWTFVSADTDIVFQTIALESSSEPITAQVMVAKCIQNRADERGLTFEQVVKQPKQFSCWNEGINPLMKPRTPQEIWNAKQAWMYAKTKASPVNLYHDISVTPYWASSPKVIFLEQIGRMRFYYERRR